MEAAKKGPQLVARPLRGGEMGIGRATNEKDFFLELLTKKKVPKASVLEGAEALVAWPLVKELFWGASLTILLFN